MTVTARIAVVVVLQTLALFTMIAMKQWTLNTGTLVVLETQPIDPRSLFRGDYVRLNYKISELKPQALAGDNEFRRHDLLYLVLEPGDPYWQPVSVHRRSPSLGGDQVAIRGEVQYINHRGRFDGAANEIEPIQVMQVRYGIESYFVPEGEGRVLERPQPGEVVSLRIAVDKAGNAGIKAVLVNGEARYTERLF